MKRSPVKITALTSLLLSAIAISGQAIVGKDAALYLHVAQQIGSNGIDVAFKAFNWPWFSILLAYTHKIFSFFSHETIAYLYSVGFSLGISTLLVSITRKLEPKATWWAVLLVLSVPAFNTFRYDIIRDTGSWFFLVLSFWLLIDARVMTWLRGALFQLAVIAAVLFRLETVFVVLAVAIYFLFFTKSLSWKQRFFLILKCNSLFLLGGIAILLFATWKDLLSQQRIANFVSLIDPSLMYKELQSKSGKFAKVALRKWSYDDAPIIMVAGMAFALLYHQFQYGLLASALLLTRKGRSHFFMACKQHPLLAIAAVLFFAVLLVFFIQRGFENSRYGTPFILLLLPLLAITASKVFKHYSKWSIVFIFLCCMLALSNVVHTSPSKKHYLQAAQWLEQNVDKKAHAIYYFDQRIDFYSGGGYSTRWQREFLKMNTNHARAYKYFIVRDSAKKDTVQQHAKKLGLKEIESFSNKKTTLYVFENPRAK